MLISGLVVIQGNGKITTNSVLMYTYQQTRVFHLVQQAFKNELLLTSFICRIGIEDRYLHIKDMLRLT